MEDVKFDTALARMIDHTLLKPDACEADILRLCNEARTYGFASVCVNPGWVGLCSAMLRDTPSRVCTVIGFPLGCNRTETKCHETEFAMKDGAGEFDMVLHIGRLRQGDLAYVRNDIAAVAKIVKSGNERNQLKVILETCLLTQREVALACGVVVDAGADFVKTSTGFSVGGATGDMVRLMRETVGQEFGVKASGGIRDRVAALEMIEAGANRIGASASIAIVSSR
jgi:deoxyribose-phosphate aldolase